MRHKSDPLASLLPSHVIPHAEQMNMPYLGYHLLRETLTRTLLGESEAPILYWLGKDLGKAIPIESPNGSVMPFIRLGLGKLELVEETIEKYRYRLSHSIYAFLPVDRLNRSLSFECGIIAGAIGSWRGKSAHAQSEISAAGNGKNAEVTIAVSL